MSCGYQGKHFGAWYEDAICIDGYLWDLDSCDEPDLITPRVGLPWLSYRRERSQP